MTPELLLLIDAILILPTASSEKELQRRIAAIHAVTAYYGMEEGRSYLYVRRGRPPNPSTTTMTPSGTLLAFDRFLEGLEEPLSLLSLINFSHELASSYAPCSLLILKPSEKGCQESSCDQPR
jgi:hypothetical protein